MAVLDLMGGVVVHGIAGRRAEYRPVVSTLCEGCEPISVARAIRDYLGITQIYLADLDSINGKEPSWIVYDGIADLGVRPVVDSGVRDVEQGQLVLEHARLDVVLGLETIPSPDIVARLVQRDSRRVIFSLDLHEGVPLRHGGEWKSTSLDIADQVYRVGVRRMIVLDLARVGVGGGTGTQFLCSELRQRYPDLEIIAGGGVRNRKDLERLKDIGINGTLVASILHRGELTQADIEALQGDQSPRHS